MLPNFKLDYTKEKCKENRNGKEKEKPLQNTMSQRKRKRKNNGRPVGKLHFGYSETQRIAWREENLYKLTSLLLNSVAP